MAELPAIPSKAKWTAGYVAALGVDLGLAALGVPGAGAASASMQVLQVLTTKAAEAALAETEAHLRRTANAEARLAHLENDAEELRTRLAGVARVIHEAGRHPDKELQRALGRFAARVLLQEVDQIEALELAEVLGRMTFLDFTVLRVAAAAWDASSTDLRRAAPPSVLIESVRASLPGIAKERFFRSAQRLETMDLAKAAETGHSMGMLNRGLPMKEMSGWAPTSLGRRLLDMTSEAGAQG